MNIQRMLAELANQGSISSAVEKFLTDFFESMRLKDDITEEDVHALPREISVADFDNTSFSTDFLSGRFEQSLSRMLAEGAIQAALDGDITSKDLDKCAFIFCRVHAMTEKTN